MPITSDKAIGGKRRGRPPEFDRDVALDAAVELFWKRGFAATTTRDLERALGIRPSSLYNTFGSKRALLDETLDRYESLTSRALLEPLEQSTRGLRSIDEFFERLVQWVTEEGRAGCMLVNLMTEDGGATPALAKRCVDYRQRVRGALRTALERTAAAGEMNGNDLDLRAELLLGMVLGVNVACRGGAPRSEIEGLLDALRAQIAAWK